MLNNYICALDIGSSKISAVVVQAKKGHIENIFFETLPAKGVKKCVVINSVELTNCISQVLKRLKAKSGIRIKSVYAGISGQDIIAKHSRAIIPLAERGNRVIAAADIHQVNEQARILGSSIEDEIIHQIPFNYAIDSNHEIANPLGLYSHKLELDLYLICMRLSFLQALDRITNQAGYELDGLFFSGLATSRVVFNRELRGGTTVLCDIGSDITELLLFKGGVLKDINILAIGGDELTFAVSGTLNVSFELAEEIKRSYGVIGEYNHLSQEKEVLVKKDNSYKPIRQKVVSEVVTQRARLICQEIKEGLDKLIPSGRIDNFVITGRAIMQEGFLELLEHSLALAVKIGRVSHSDILAWVYKDENLSGQKYLAYLTALGIIVEALDRQKPQVFSGVLTSGNPVSKILQRIKEIYQGYF